MGDVIQLFPTPERQPLAPRYRLPRRLRLVSTREETRRQEVEREFQEAQQMAGWGR
jgi:type VI protein secretion system component VasA